MKKKIDASYIRLIVLYAAYFLPLGASAYTSVYLSGRGVSDAQIGTLMSLAPLIALVFQPLWGQAGDRAKYKRSVLALSFLLTGAVCLLYDVAAGVVALLCVMTAYSAVSQGISPLAQSICMEYSNDYTCGFGPIRMSGSIAYMVMLFLPSFAPDSMKHLFLIMGVCFLACSAYALRIPPVRGYQHESTKISPFTVLKDKRIAFLMAMTFCGKTASGFYVSFFNLYTSRTFTANTMSVMAVIAIILEIPFLMFSNRLRTKMKITTWVLVGFLLNAIRFIGIAFIETPWIVMLLQFTGVSVMACFEFFPVLYMNDIVVKELRSSMQSMNTLITFGVTQLTGTMLGGFIGDKLGLQAAFGIYGVFLIAAFLAFLIPARKMNMQWQDKLS